MPIAWREAPHFHRLADKPSERFAAGVIEHQHGPAMFAHEFQRPRRPGPVQFAFQLVVMGEAVKVGR